MHAFLTLTILPGGAPARCLPPLRRALGASLAELRGLLDRSEPVWTLDPAEQPEQLPAFAALCQELAALDIPLRIVLEGEAVGIDVVHNLIDAHRLTMEQLHNEDDLRARE